jgi:hypothetical protein
MRHINGPVRHLDVGSTHPGGGAAPKGLAVRQLKRYVSWVQTVKRTKIEYTRRLSEVILIEKINSYRWSPNNIIDC